MYFQFWDFERFVHFCILYFRNSAFPTFGSAEMQKCRHNQINRHSKSEKTQAHRLYFFTFEISSDLLISENRKRFSKMRKSIEIWKVKKYKQFAYVFSLLKFRAICLFLHSAILHFRLSEVRKCRNAEMQT